MKVRHRRRLNIQIHSGYFNGLLGQALGPKPRRVLIILIALTLFLVWHGYTETFFAASAKLSRVVEDGKVTQEGFELSLKSILALLYALKFHLAKLAACFFCAWVISLAMTSLILEKSLYQNDPQVASLVGLLSRKAGITDVYPSEKQIAIQLQPYAKQMIVDVSKSNRMRLMTIAGFEYFGKGRDSLLYDVVKNHAEMSVEVILLNPKTGADVLKERVQRLKKRDDSITESTIEGHIAATCGLLGKLKTERPEKVELLHCRQCPVFRVLLLDHCLFLSTYENDAHGHETPVFRVNKDSELSWYYSFEKLYYQHKATAVQVTT